jgi:hypothetical protein
MPRLPARVLRFLRLGALMLLVLGLLVRPVVDLVGGLHAAEHAVQAAAVADHGHAHPGEEPAGDPDHTRGSHGLMHQAECGATVAPWPAWTLALGLPPSATAALPDVIAPRLGVPATPFRPPIA